MDPPSRKHYWGISVDNSGVYVAGSTSGTLPGQVSSGNLDAFVRKYDVNGIEVWTRQFGSEGVDVATGISVDASGVYVAASTYVRKYDVNGIEVWTRQYPLGGANGISVDASGIYVSGWLSNGTFPGQTNFGGIDGFVSKYDSNGNEVWTRQFGSEGHDFVTGISVDASGVYVTGEVTSALPGQTYLGGEGDAFVRKYDTNGVEVWTNQFGTGAWDFANGISVYASSVYATMNLASDCIN